MSAGSALTDLVIGVNVIVKSLKYFLFNFRWPFAKKYYNEQYNKEFQQKTPEEDDKQKHKKCLSFINTGIDCVRQLRNLMLKIMFEHDSLLEGDHTLYKSKEVYLEEDLISLCLKENVNDIRSKKRSIIRVSRNYLRFLQDEEEIMFKTEYYINILFFMDEIRHLLSQPPR